MSKIKIKNELPELLEAVCNHKDCPDWLALAIWDAFAERNQACTFTALHWRAEFEEMKADRSGGQSEVSE